MGLVSVLWKEFNDFKNLPDETVTVTLDQFHTTKKNVITGTGFKLDFISEKKKHTILSHKRFKKSKILAMGKKSCIASTILAAPVFW